jgi:hypothetical protein
LKNALHGLFVVLFLLFAFSTIRSDDMPVELDIQILNVAQTGDIALSISNLSNKPLKLWKDSNSWGAARWRVLVIRNGKIETFFQNPYQVFTVNVPDAAEIAKGASIKRTLTLNGGNWCGLEYCSSYNQRGFRGQTITFKQDDTIIVIYDVPPSKEASKMAVWHGVFAAYTTVK